MKSDITLFSCLMALLLYSCEKQNEYSNTLLLQRSVVFNIQSSIVKSFVDSLPEAKKDEYNDIIVFSDTLERVINELLAISGGIKEGSSLLINPDYSGKQVVNIFNQFKISQHISILTKKLSKTSIRKFLSRMISNDINYIMDEKLLIEKSVGIIIQDLSNVQSYINAIILKELKCSPS